MLAGYHHHKTSHFGSSCGQQTDFKNCMGLLPQVLSKITNYVVQQLKSGHG